MRRCYLNGIRSWIRKNDSIINETINTYFFLIFYRTTYFTILYISGEFKIIIIYHIKLRFIYNILITF